MADTDLILRRDGEAREAARQGAPLDKAARDSLIADLIAAGRTTPPGLQRDRLRAALQYWLSVRVVDEERLEAIPSLDDYEAPPPSAAPSEGAGTGAGKAAPLPARPSPAPPPVFAGMASPAALADPTPGGPPADRPRQAAESSGGPLSPIAAEIRGRQHDFEMIRWGAAAAQWQRSPLEVQRGLLLDSRAAIRQAKRFQDDDPAIRAFVEACERSYRKRTGRRVGLGLALAGLISTLGWFWFMQWKANQEALTLATERRNLAVLFSAAADAANGGDYSRLNDVIQSIARGATAAGDGTSAPEVPVIVGTPATVPAGETPEQPGPAVVAVLGPLAAALEAQPPDPGPAVASPTASEPAGEAAGLFCRGFMWLGSERTRSITALPQDIMTGNQVTTSTSVNLRSALPGAGEAALPPIMGVVPEGGTARVVTAFPPIPRPDSADPALTRHQYWAEVEVPRPNCTTVLVQQADPARGAAGELLARQGFQVHVLDPVTDLKGAREVRYFWPQDAEMARQVAQAFEAEGAPLQVVERSDGLYRPDPGTLEVWIGA